MPLTIRTSRLQLRLPLPWLVLTVLGISVFVALGRWQWRRAADARRMEAAFSAAGEPQPLGDRRLAELPRYGLVEVRGVYDGGHQVLLDNTVAEGRAGYEVLTPLRLDDGRWLLVNRGWLPLVNNARSALPDVHSGLPDTPVTLRGRVDELPVPGVAAGRVPATATQGWPRLASFPETADLRAALGQPLEARQLLLAADLPGGYLRNWQPASASFPPERHLAYAAQWWSLAGLTAALFLIRNLRRRNA